MECFEETFKGFSACCSLLPYAEFCDRLHKPFLSGRIQFEHKIALSIRIVLKILTATDILFAGGCGVLCCLCLYYYAKKPGHRTIDRLLFLVGLAFVLLAAWRYVTKTYIFDDDWFTTYHFDAYFYPLYKVYSGQTPLIDLKTYMGSIPIFSLRSWRSCGATCTISACSRPRLSPLLSVDFFQHDLLLKNRLFDALYNRRHQLDG
jgi:hypothetical protein